MTEFRVFWHDGTLQRLEAAGYHGAITRAVALRTRAGKSGYITRIEERQIDGSGRATWVHP